MALYNESLQISKAMHKCNGVPQHAITLDTKGLQKLTKIIQTNKETFIDYLHLVGVLVEYSSETTNSLYKDKTIMTLPTQCFKVDFNDNSVRIAPLK